MPAEDLATSAAADSARSLNELRFKQHHELAQELVDEVAASSNPQLDGILARVDAGKLVVAILAARVVDVRIDCDEQMHALHARLATQDDLIEALHSRVRELRGDYVAV